MSFSSSAVGPHGEMRSVVTVTSSTEPMIPPTRKSEQVMDDYTAKDVGADEEEKLALPPTPATRSLHLIDKFDKLKTELRLAMTEAADEGQEEKPVYTRTSRGFHFIDKIDKLKTELRLAMAEAADEGVEEKPVYVCISNYIQGRFGCDWYMYDLVKKQRMKVFGRMEWAGGVRHHLPAAVVVSASVIYVVGGACPCPPDPHEIMYCKDVLYFDTKYPHDGWKVGPQLPSTHHFPFATSMDEKLYVFGLGDTVPSVLDTSVKEAGWKHLPELDRRPLINSTALPDPSRDRILLRTFKRGLLAYSLPEKKWEHLDPDFDSRFTRASIVLGDVLYYRPCNSDDEVMRAYDLVHCQQLTVVHHNLTDSVSSGYFMDWDHLLDLGCGKLCFVYFSVGGSPKVAFFLKLKVERETGENKVHITSLSAQSFNIEGDDRYAGALTL